MKAISATLFGVFAILSTMASATSIQVAQSLEPMNLKNATEIRNFMPIVPPGGRPFNTILEATVMSSGCTEAEHFEVKVLDTSAVQYIAIERIRPDFCKAKEHPIDVALNVKGLTRSKPLQILNPVLVGSMEVF